MPKLTAQLKRGAPIPAGNSEGWDCSKLGFFFFFIYPFPRSYLAVAFGLKKVV